MINSIHIRFIIRTLLKKSFSVFFNIVINIVSWAIYHDDIIAGVFGIVTFPIGTLENEP